MLVHKNSSVLVFALVSLSVRVSCMDESTVSCPRNASVDLTEETSDFSRDMKIKGWSFPPNSTWSTEDGGKRGCPCEFKTCISLCCASGMARAEGRCHVDNDTSAILPRLKKIIANFTGEGILEENYHFFTFDPCTIGWMRSFIMEDFKIWKEGSISAPEFHGISIWKFENYCLMRRPKSAEYSVKVCFPWVRKGYYQICSLVIAILIMLAIFVIFTIVPELKNLHGLIFRSYVASYIGVYVFAMGVMYTTELRINPIWFSLVEITARYFAASCAFWLNVMSFNIWRSFRDLRQNLGNFRKRERNTFIRYSIYAWLCPIVLIAIANAFTIYVPDFREDTVGDAIIQWVSVGLVTLALLCNVFLHTSTALNIRRQKKETAYLADGVNKHYEVNKQWFNLYWKLFVIMGAHIVVWPIWLIWPTDATLDLLATLEVLQSVIIFVIFVWSDSVKQSLCKRVGISLVRSDNIEI